MPTFTHTDFTTQLGIEVPVICGAMYPCSNPELVAAVSEAGGIGVIQPISLQYVHGHDFRAGLQLMKSLTDRPLGMNVITEKSSKVYEERMRNWTDIALEEGVRFFVTSLGDPKWVVEKAHAVGGVVYHDVTGRRHAEKGLESGADGIIAVNRRAGGHAGPTSLEALYEELAPLGVPLVAAGGVSEPEDLRQALDVGYVGVQMGTRFIATTECNAHPDYKQAILDADEDDIVLTERLTGVPVAVIETPYIEKIGTKAGPIGRFLLSKRRTKHFMRTVYSLMAIRRLKKASLEGSAYEDYWQAGKSVAGIDRIVPAGEVVRQLAEVVSAPRAAASPPTGSAGSGGS